MKYRKRGRKNMVFSYSFFVCLENQNGKKKQYTKRSFVLVSFKSINPIYIPRVPSNKIGR